ncbi:hypothetical protein [Labilibaculum sp.]|uniref:hypothetical protein n=1 Tax=Labilibaculum sp. TaxID=2060723 RepID=UPI0035635BE0
MVDGIGVKNIPFPENYWLTHPLLKDLKRRTTSTIGKSNTGESFGSESTFVDYRGIKFSDNSIRGSIHKFHNQGKHNNNDFSRAEIIETLKELHSDFSINPLTVQVTNPEFGFNIDLPFPVNQFLNTILWQGGQANGKPLVNQKGIEFKHENYYWLKIYMKDFENRLRVEIKPLRKVFYKQTGINNLIDIADADKLKVFFKILIEKFSEVVCFDDSININDLGKRDTKAYDELKNGYNWEKYNKKQRHDKKQTLKRLIDQYGNRDYKSIIIDLLEKKFAELINDDIKTCNLLHDFEKDLNQEFKPKHVTYYSVDKGKKRYKLNNDRKCKITGLGISMQKDNSILLSHVGLRYYLEHEPTIFEEVKRKHLTRKWFHSELDIQIREIAHNIRDCYRNRNRKYGSLEDQSSLF